MTPDPTISVEAQKLCLLYLRAEMSSQKVAPIVRMYKVQILKDMKAKDANTNEPVTDPDLAHMLSGKAFKKYIDLRNDAANKSGLYQYGKTCPSLSAEIVRITAMWNFLDHILGLLPDFEEVTHSQLLLNFKNSSGNIEYNGDKVPVTFLQILFTSFFGRVSPYIDKSLVTPLDDETRCEILSAYDKRHFKDTCPHCGSGNVRRDYDFPDTMRCCDSCFCDYNINREVILNPDIL